jgi:hypothetical protein
LKRDAYARELFGELMTPHILEAPEPGIILPVEKYGEDFDIIGLMSDARDPDTGLLRDLKIDDRDLAHASSFYDYAFNIIGEDAHPPWMVQMWIGLLLFAEICPVCSDKRWLDLEWFVTHVPKDKPSKEIKEGLKILRHGVCPKCKRNKHELIVNHGLHNYTELVNVLGQRSGKSSSAALYESYHLHRILKFPRLADHTKAMQKSTELTLTFVSLTFAKAVGLLWTPFINTINESSWFCLAEGSKITLASGEQQPIEKIIPGTCVKTLEGSYPVVSVFDNGLQACFTLTLEDAKVLTGTGSHKIRCLSEDGESLTWKTIEEIQEGDLVLTE